MKVSPRQQKEALDRLREWLKPEDAVYTILRHTSRSGGRHTVELLQFIPGTDGRLVRRYLSGSVAQALGWPYNEKVGGIVTDTGGMDFGFDLVYNLSYRLFGRGDALRQEWI